TLLPSSHPRSPYTSLFRALSHSDAAIARQLFEQANQQIFFSRQPFPDDPWQEVYTVQNGDLMVRIANRFFSPYEFICKINGNIRSEEHTSELQSRENLVCR